MASAQQTIVITCGSLAETQAKSAQVDAWGIANPGQIESKVVDEEAHTITVVLCPVID